MGEQTLSGSIRVSIDDYVVCGGTAGYTNTYSKEFVTLDELRARGFTDDEIRLGDRYAGKGLTAMLVPVPIRSMLYAASAAKAQSALRADTR
jgi:hypothetical protein